MSVISPTVSSFWLVTERPLILDENISSLETVENLASAGAVPVVLCSSAAKAGLASTAREAAISANFFILSSSEAIVLLLNARMERLFPRKIGFASGRCAGLVVEEPEQRFCRILRAQRRNRYHRLVARAAPPRGGVAHHGRQPARDRMRVAQIGVREHHDDGAVRSRGAEIHLAHQPADDA